MIRVILLFTTLMIMALPALGEGLDSLKYLEDPGYTYDIPALKNTTTYTRARPMGGQHGIPSVSQTQATGADSLTIADSINFTSYFEFSIDGDHWFADTLTEATITDTSATFTVSTIDRAWNWFRKVIEGGASCDSSGDVTVKEKISWDKNRVTW